MLVTSLRSRWIGADGKEVLSIAAITHHLSQEVLATGHERCIVPIKPETVDSWLNSDPKVPAGSWRSSTRVRRRSRRTASRRSVIRR